MTLINTKLHGWIDYVFALSLIGLPWLFGYNRQAIETVVCLATGLFIILYSLFTNYETGLLKLKGLPMKLHLALDILTGIFFACAPWLFGFSDRSYLPFLCLGICAVLIALCTDRVAYARLGPDALRH